MVGGARMLSHGVIFNLGSTKVCSPAIIETYFSYDKDIWIAVTELLKLYPKQHSNNPAEKCTHTQRKKKTQLDWSTTNPTLTGYQHSLSHVIL